MVTSAAGSIGVEATARAWIRIAAYVFFFVLLGLRMHVQRTPYFEDDAAFFLRYAENIAAGHGWRWNVEEAPVWGASAPLWPLVIAGGILAGLDASEATVLVSVLFTLLAAGMLARASERLFGWVGVVALAPFLAVNHLFSTWATSGMESPMTFACIAAALLVASGAGGPLALGCAAGACLVHKLDLAPLGLTLLLGALTFRRCVFWRGVVYASLIAAVWYGFALWHFGSLVPNSFLRKLSLSGSPLAHSWFADNALYGSGGWLRLLFALLGTWVLGVRAWPTLVALAAIGVPTLAYTMKPPMEPFMWYVAATSPASSFLAGAGLAWLVRRADGSLPARARGVLAFGLAAVFVWPLHRLEWKRTRDWHEYLADMEPMFISSGAWIDRHVPADARVMTGWGHSAYASRRFTYDSTFLNRPPEVGLIERRSPEALVVAPRERGSPFEPIPRYRPVRMFLPVDPDGRRGHHLLAFLREDVPLLGDPDEPLGPGLSPGVLPPVLLRKEERQQLVHSALLAGKEVEAELLQGVDLDGLAIWASKLTAHFEKATPEERERTLARYPGFPGLSATIATLRQGEAGATPGSSQRR